MKRRNKRKLKIISKKKFIFNIFILLVIFIGISFFTSKSFGKREIHTYNYTVAREDTLWNISKIVCKNSNDKNLNIQSVVKDIKYRNNLKESSIYEGQVLQIPIY